MLVAALVVAVVALAGIGYATSPEYKATTTNNDNTLDSTYIVLKQGEDGKYFDLFEAIYYNTVTTKASTDASEVTTYTPVYDYLLDQTNGYQKISGEQTGAYALVSKVLTLNIEKTNSNASSAKMTIEASNFTGITGLKYTMVLVKDPGSSTAIPVTYQDDVTEATNGKAVWEIDIALNNTAGEGYTAQNAPTEYAVYLFVSLANSATPATPAEGQSMATGGFGSTTTKSIFTFTVDVEAVA